MANFLERRAREKDKVVTVTTFYDEIKKEEKMRKTLVSLFVGMLSLMLLITSCARGPTPTSTTTTRSSEPAIEMGERRLEERAQGFMNAFFDGKVDVLNSFVLESERVNLDKQTQVIEELASTGTLRESGWQYELTERSLSSDQRSGYVQFIWSAPAVPESGSGTMPIRIQFSWKSGDYFFTTMETGFQDQARLAGAKSSMDSLRLYLALFGADHEGTYPSSIDVSTGDPLVPTYLSSEEWNNIQEGIIEFSYSLLPDGSFRIEAKAKDWHNTLVVATPAGRSP